ncbi:ATP-binding protein [Streptomyces yerevanensis]|uniref:ATP-binding protein n=1 Tax=Streptomyces yerevanensis TaxID=66378 RepID=UPI0007C463FF|nr:ATP-binding protein [Streptomyces yerevanensis]
MTSDDRPRVRLLPWTGDDDKPCLLLTDGTGTGVLSRHADRIEAAQLGLVERLLDRAREAAAAPEARTGELRTLVEQLTDGLRDALLIADNRDARPSGGERFSAGEFRALCLDQGSPGLPEGSHAAPPLIEAVHDLLAYRSAVPHALGLRSFPGRDLTSASAARHYVRDTASAWGLPKGMVDDLETVTGELTANALEHSDSHTVTVALARMAGAAVVSVTDEGRGCRGHRPVPEPTSPPPDQEYGRGLLITEVLATRWGQRRVGRGLTVWAVVEE